MEGIINFIQKQLFCWRYKTFQEWLFQRKEIFWRAGKRNKGLEISVSILNKKRQTVAGSWNGKLVTIEGLSIFSSFFAIFGLSMWIYLNQFKCQSSLRNLFNKTAMKNNEWWKTFKTEEVAVAFFIYLKVTTMCFILFLI